MIKQHSHTGRQLVYIVCNTWLKQLQQQKYDASRDDKVGIRTTQQRDHCTLRLDNMISYHDDVIKWKHFPRKWPFVRGIHRSRGIPHTKASDAEL